MCRKSIGGHGSLRMCVPAQSNILITALRRQKRTDGKKRKNNIKTSFVSILQAGKGNDSFSELRKVVQLKPDHADAQLQLADALFAKGNLEEAKMHYSAALGADSKLAVAHNSLGRLYLAQGQISQAIVQFGEA